MGDLLTTGSVLAAFFAGGVTLFAPCCIVFLAPSYLAVAVKNRRWRLLPFTFVFAAGLALVLVPITLGMGLLAGAIANYHAPLYYAGAVLMFALAALSLSGRMWSLPSFIASPDTTRGDTASFFSLGVFAGVASSCCAPVLAGVMTLSALSGSAIGGLTLGVAYVFGMVFPLFVMALIWDKAHLADRRWMRVRVVRLRLAGQVLVTNSLNIAIATAFVIMGSFVLYLAAAGEMTGGSAAQGSVGRSLSGTFERIQQWLTPVPEVVQGLALLAVAAVFVVATLRRRPPPETDHADDPQSCHGHQTTPESTAAQTAVVAKEPNP